jgi:hypothetical protein
MPPEPYHEDPMADFPSVSGDSGQAVNINPFLFEFVEKRDVPRLRDEDPKRDVISV